MTIGTKEGHNLQIKKAQFKFLEFYVNICNENNIFFCDSRLNRCLTSARSTKVCQTDALMYVKRMY